MQRKLSAIGTVTPKHFRMMPLPRRLEVEPRGVWDYKRMPMTDILTGLPIMSLDIWYRLRIACCAYLQVSGDDKLQDCGVCRHNHGYVCPRCLGAGWLSDAPYNSLAACPDCMIEVVGEKGKIFHEYDGQKELTSVQNWLDQRFPFGVPTAPTEHDLILMDYYHISVP